MNMVLFPPVMVILKRFLCYWEHENFLNGSWCVLVCNEHITKIIFWNVVVVAKFQAFGEKLHSHQGFLLLCYHHLWSSDLIWFSLIQCSEVKANGFINKPKVRLLHWWHLFTHSLMLTGWKPHNRCYISQYRMFFTNKLESVVIKSYWGQKYWFIWRDLKQD